MTAALVGTGSLVRLALRRDRITLPIWIIALTGVTVSVVPTIEELYPTLAARQQLAGSLGSNPALLALTGPAFDLSGIGGIVAWRLGGSIAVLAALMSTFAVVRHTRAEEETGRLELLGATVVGRHAPLAASLIVAYGANIVLALGVAGGLAGQGLPANGSVAFGLAVALAGCVFASVAAVTAQLTENARGANGLAGAVLGAAFLLRAAGDSGGDTAPWLSWLSPIGWAQRTRPFAGERWEVMLLAVSTAAVLVVAAFALVARRDIGAGLLPVRPGRPATSPALRGPVGLAWRLHRGALVGWTVGFAAAGAAYGAVAKGIESLLDDTPQAKEVLTQLGGDQALVDAYFATTLTMIGLVASVYAVQATLRLRSEETGLRAEPVLVTGIRRAHWVASHLVFTVAGTAIVLLGAGFMEGLVHGLRVGDVGGQLPRLLGGALVQVPAALVVAGIAVALFGLAPRAAVASWAVIVAFLVLGQLGPLLGAPPWLMDLSPFTHVPRVPGTDVTAAPLLWLTGVAVLLALAGLAGFRRRDVG